MGKTTKISWCDHTFNPWIGCRRVSAGCRNCYAERLNRRFRWVSAWDTPERKPTKTWKQLGAWASAARKEKVLRRVFVGSLCDVLDDEAPSAWRERLWEQLDAAGKKGGEYIEFLLLTKRTNNFHLLPQRWLWQPPPYIRLGVTVENRSTSYRMADLDKIWYGKNFVSAEPILGIFDLPDFIHWVVVAGESAEKPEDIVNPVQFDWVNHLYSFADIPFFFKGWGSYLPKCEICSGRMTTRYIWRGKNYDNDNTGGNTTHQYPKPFVTLVVKGIV